MQESNAQSNDRKRPSNGNGISDKPPESWGEYMDSKRSKLYRQADEALAHRDPSRQPSSTADYNDDKIFEGICIHANGCAIPSNEELKEMVLAHGGRYDHYFSRSSTTHIVAENLAATKITALQKEKVIKIVHPKWITDSIAMGSLLDCQDYSLFDGQGNFRRLSFDDTNDEDGEELDISENADQDYLEEDNEEGNERSDEISVSIMTGTNSNREPTTFKSNEPSLKAGDPGFLEVFFAKSRLHHLSAAGNEFKKYVEEKRLTGASIFPGIDKLKVFLESQSETETSAPVLPNGSKLIMHIDMDCFFVSVGLLKRPDLVGQPVAVSHAKTGRGQIKPPEDTEVSKVTSTEVFNSFSEVASCNYEARAFGVKNGMLLGTAKTKCPNLKVIPYNFEEYSRVSKILYDLICSFTLDIEAVSCDEMFVDIRKVLDDVDCGPEMFAMFVRKEMKELTECNSSVGIGPNILIAKLASKSAKPNGHLYVPQDGVDAFMMKQNVASLPGIGWATRDKLAEVFNVESCMDLMQVPKDRLKSVFGVKTGDNLYNACRGIDRSDLKFEQSKERKSVSVEVNYGIRFTQWIQLESFLKELSAETVKRLNQASAKGKRISLKLKIKSKNAPKETAKFMGHGICDNVTRSTQFPIATDTLDAISRTVISLVKSLKDLIVSDVRGIGIQVTRLSFNDEPNVTTNRLESNVTTNRLESNVKSMTIEELFMNTRNSSENSTLSRLTTHDTLSWNDLDPEVLKDLPLEIQEEIRVSFGQQNFRTNSPVKKSSGSSTGRFNGKKESKKNKSLVSKTVKNLPGPLDKMFNKNRETNESNLHSQVLRIMKERGSVCGFKDIVSITDVLREWVMTEPFVQDEDVAYITKCLLDACSLRHWNQVKAMMVALHDAITERNQDEDEAIASATSLWSDAYNTLIEVIKSELQDVDERSNQETNSEQPSTSSLSTSFLEMQELKNVLNQLTSYRFRKT